MNNFDFGMLTKDVHLIYLHRCLSGYQHDFLCAFTVGKTAGKRNIHGLKVTMFILNISNVFTVYTYEAFLR